MIRTTKKPSERRLEIMQTAQELFRIQGYEGTSVNTIIEKMGVAKGTFYHYFKSKNDLLSAIVDDLLNRLVIFAETVSKDTSLNSLEKIEKILSSQNNNNTRAGEMKESLHIPENRELHEKTNVQLVLRFSPIISEIVEQGIYEGIFKVKNTLETIQFLLIASQFLFDEGLFKWNTEEWKVRRKVMQEVIEKSLGAKRGAFKFLNNR
ncbi:TetR/AcrR family transcriptional regulator [Candidatus Peregrinibacteria bacterium]|nr:MAG: TetR/AcrR family transcriptional regulator [Candidatus Peregrinibacteria bacterium]